MNTFNEKLAKWIHSTPAKDAGINNIQLPGQPELVIWQTRYKEPTVYEQDLVQHLLQAFSEGVTEINDLVAALNQQGFRCESGELWTIEKFSKEIERLGY